MHANLKRRNRVYMLKTWQACRLMGVHAPRQSFHKSAPFTRDLSKFLFGLLTVYAQFIT